MIDYSMPGMTGYELQIISIERNSCGRTFTSSAAQLLLLVTAMLYGYGILASDMFWSRVVRNIRLLANGEDWSKFFKVVIFLYLFKWIVSYSLALLIGIILVFAFTAFFVYEQYESVIEGSGAFLLFCIVESKGLIMRTLPASITVLLQNDNVSRQEKTQLS